MPDLIKRLCPLLLALPTAAFAVPVTVVTHSTGTASVHPTVLHALGQDQLPPEDELPYELTLTSTFDWTGPLPARGAGPYMVYDTPVVVDFRMGDLVYHADGKDWSSADLYTPPLIGGDAYWHTVSVNPHPYVYGYSFDFEHVFRGPPGSMGPGGALTPAAFGSAGNPAGYMDITAFYSNDEYTFIYTMSGDIATYSVQVTSPVPEPAAFVLLAAGLATLGLHRRRKG